jgi:hypothetical protein
MGKGDTYNTSRERKRDSKKSKSEYQIYSSKHIRNITMSSVNNTSNSKDIKKK